MPIASLLLPSAADRVALDESAMSTADGVLIACLLLALVLAVWLACAGRRDFSEGEW